MIFDKDGTLMELHHYWSGMSGLRADKITEALHLTPGEREHLLYAMGVDVRRKKLLPHGPVGIKKREVVMQAAVDYLATIGHEKTHDLCHDVFEEIDRISTGIIGRLVIPIPGAGELLESLHAAGCRVAIATTDRSYRADLAMEALGFTKNIDFVAGADLVSEPKPSPEMIYYILDTLRVEKSEALMVGDAITDVEMGCRAGLTGTVGVLTGQTSREDLQRITPYIIGSVADMAVSPDSE